LSKQPELPKYGKAEPVKSFQGFTNLDAEGIKNLHQRLGLAMKLDDLLLIQTYFKGIKRNPTETEIFVLDTYWSDHCRHTTFETILEDIQIEDQQSMPWIKKSLLRYFELRKLVHKKDKPMTLMDIATLYAKYMIKSGLADDIEVTEEVNACSIKIEVENELYLLMFKNETHNHPTEIEPFGGASTCIGGAIRDPLSGRAYVYQAARVTGASNILAPISQTRKGKLPQAVITKKATEGFSSYGNQIGLATTLVREIYHKGYEAKRLELGAVVGTVRYDHIQREKPLPGDFIILIGGKTGRDGIGGATGSSKAHDIKSITEASSEVQKGNAPIERKLQRLFMHQEITRIIKKANDFGAGGVAVAIGELADGITIDLDQVPTKYYGLNATEIAISESQERMAVVIDPRDLNILKHYVNHENLTHHHVATVTESKRLIMVKDSIEVLNIERSFLTTNGVRQSTKAFIEKPLEIPLSLLKTTEIFDDAITQAIQSMNTASQKGMIEYFDSTIGATTVLMPFGGKTLRTEVDASVQKLPIKDIKTDVASVLTFGFNPEITSWSPYHGAYLAVVEAISKSLAVNSNYRKIRFSFQEYFKKLGNDPKAWGSVTAALLGALQAQEDYQMPAIGGKDSMSGTFEELHVPPTFVAFAVTTAQASKVISPEFKEPGNYIYLYSPPCTNYLPIANELIKDYDFIQNNMNQMNIISAKALLQGGWLEAVLKMSFGNSLGLEFDHHIDIFDATTTNYGGLVIESRIPIERVNFRYLGETIDNPRVIFHHQSYHLDQLHEKHLSLFGHLYPTYKETNEKSSAILDERIKEVITKEESNIIPKVCIAAFPGTNCELDSKHAFIDAGAAVDIVLFRNQNQKAIEESIIELSNAIDQSDIFMIPGGFSAGDEPDGSGKFIAAILLNHKIKASIERLQARKGLILGICNGFQALIKSGLLPFGRLCDIHENSPTLTLNTINRHVSKMVRTKVISNHSPWYQKIKPNTIHVIPVSHGEGRFYANQDILNQMIQNHQIITQYVDSSGIPTMDGNYNPNGSILAIEGIVSPDGRILGKMAHSERYGDHLYKNIYGNKQENIFKSAVEAVKRGI
ncbi:MAG: phosphoribosylformylglycinamidine synthase, partial [Acholeplasmataceae bacterium]|nr:phosphoribosylformylglycinamidine synthase [Acholeplasmataceae bacterium]